MSDDFVLRPGQLTLADLRRLASPQIGITLDPEARAPIERAHQVVKAVIAAGRQTYGVNTGFGSLSDQLIEEADLEELQQRLVLSNAAGTGPLFPDRIVRRMMILKVNTLAAARSGVRPRLIDALLDLTNAGIHPCVPAKGSVGASGDLAPLAHLAVALIGVGDVRVEGEVIAATKGLARAGLERLRLGPKEGLAMVNGTQASTALAVEGLFASEAVYAAALITGALSVEAALGSEMPFDARIHEIRGQRGQCDVATVYRQLLASSEVRELAAAQRRVQDPYTLRCQPQVMGACLDYLRASAHLIGREVNAVTDNPLVFAETDEILYGGNFHAEPVGLASDGVALALSEIGAMSERRVALLTDANHSKLPAFLVADSGLNSGFMVAQVTAAALASENKSLAHPGSVDSIPTTANHEDFVSMATYAARRLIDMADNAAGIVAIELLAACQGLEFHRPVRSSETLESVLAAVRERVPAYTQDRFFAPDLEAAKELVANGWFLQFVPLEARLTT